MMVCDNPAAIASPAPRLSAEDAVLSMASLARSSGLLVAAALLEAVGAGLSPVQRLAKTQG